jgi:hypothetical protein
MIAFINNMRCAGVFVTWGSMRFWAGIGSASQRGCGVVAMVILMTVFLASPALAVLVIELAMRPAESTKTELA